MNDNPLTALSLFTGAGGGELAWQHLLGHRTLGYVEWDSYCQRVLQARISDGLLDDAPIFGDIREFIAEGYTRRYRGMVDVVSGGFPCQPFSVAGKRQGADDERNMWPATIECIREIRPRYCFLENVPGLLAKSHGYFGTILGDLAEAGYDARWLVLSAAQCGALHRRERLWIMAYSNSRGLPGSRIRPKQSRRSEAIRPSEVREKREVPDALSDGLRGVLWEAGQGQDGPQLGPNADRESIGVGGSGPPRTAGDVPNPLDRGIQPRTERTGRETGADADRGGEGAGMGNTGLSRGIRGPGRPCEEEREGPPGEAQRPGWWSTEPDVGRVAHGVGSRVDKLRALGNGQVPAVAATAWRLLEGE